MFAYRRFCERFVIPIHDFIIKLDGKDELPTKCMKYVKASKVIADVDLADELSIDGECIRA